MNSSMFIRFYNIMIRFTLYGRILYLNVLKDNIKGLLKDIELDMACNTKHDAKRLNEAVSNWFNHDSYNNMNMNYSRAIHVQFKHCSQLNF